MRFSILPLILISAMTMSPRACAGIIPEGFCVLPSSMSPDGRYGLLFTDDAHYEEDIPQNHRVEAAAGRVIAVIRAETGMERMNQGGAEAQWSDDGSLLCWNVEGKSP